MELSEMKQISPDPSLRKRGNPGKEAARIWKWRQWALSVQNTSALAGRKP
jgi:hypothetical protein